MSSTDRLRVAHVITRMIVGGAQETVLLAAALADRDRFDPVVVTGPQTGSEGSLHDQLRDRGVEVVVLPELVREVSPLTDLRSVGALARTFRRLGADVVHTNSSKAGVVGRLAARRAGVRRVLHTVHGWPFHEHQSRAASLVWTGLERRCAPLAEHLVVVADADRAKGLAAGVGRPEQYVTVRSGLELSTYGPDPVVREQVRAELGIAPDAPVVGAVNRLSPQKDPRSLVRAAAVPLRADPSARLLLVGDGPLREDVLALAAELGIVGQVLSLGLRRDVERLLTAVDVFVSASLWEGLPRTVLQAMATRVPVVATAADGIVDVVDDGRTGLLVPPGRPAELGAAVQRVLREPALGAALATAAAERLPEFDATVMVRRLERLYAGEQAVSGPLVEVLMSTYDGERFVAEQVASVLSQTHGHLRLVVRDDGSRDGTLAVLDGVEDARLVVRRGENLGLPEAFFRLLDESSDDADLWALCDQDDVWLPHKLERAVARLATVEGPALYCARVAVVGEQLQPLYLHELPWRGPSLANALVQNVALGCTVVVNRAARDLLRGRWPRDCVMHDAWAYLVVAALGTVVYDHEPVVLYRQHGSNSVGMGRGPVSRLAGRVRRQLSPDGPGKHGRQDAELLRLHDLPSAARDDAQALLSASRTPAGRLRYAARGSAHRQTTGSDLVLRALQVLGRV